MSEVLPPDELGRVAEDLFANLCGRARLRRNKSDQDVTGWDFLVEFMLEEAGGVTPLDKRQAPKCVVQLKSTAGEHGHRVLAKLSAIDLIAKDVRPAFVIVFRMTRAGNPVRGYLIHLIGDQLARILRRLRVAEARRQYAINRASISFNYHRDGTPFDLTPEGLKAALEQAMGDDPVAYVVEKQRQLAELGYENGHLEGEAVVRVDGPDHLKNIMLGIAPLTPERLTMFDRRFGIRIPYQGPLLAQIDEFRVNPPKVGDCEIIIRGDAFAPPARFAAEMVVIPPIEEETILYITHPDFTIRLHRDGLNFQTNGLFEDGRRTLASWVMLTRALSYMSQGRGSLTIDRYRDDAPPITVAVTEAIDGPHLEQMPSIATMLESWQKLLEMAGVSASSPFPFSAIWDSDLASLATDLLLNPAPVARFEIDQVEGPAPGEVIEALYYNVAELAGDAIFFAAEIRMEPIDATSGYRSASIKPVDVRPAAANLKSYGNELAEGAGYRMLIDPDSLTIVNPNERVDAGRSSKAENVTK